jgi:hypothetical protein
MNIPESYLVSTLHTHTSYMDNSNKFPPRNGTLKFTTNTTILTLFYSSTSLLTLVHPYFTWHTSKHICSCVKQMCTENTKKRDFAQLVHIFVVSRFHFQMFQDACADLHHSASLICNNAYCVERYKAAQQIVCCTAQFIHSLWRDICAPITDRM